MDKKTNKTHIKITKYKKGGLLIPKNSAETELQKARSHERLGWALCLTGALGAWAPIIADELGVDEKRLEQIENVWAIGAISVIPALLGFGVVFGLSDQDKKITEAHLKELLNDAMENEVFRTELAKLAPVFQKILNDILEKKPELASYFLHMDLNKMNEQFVFAHTHDYLKQHPKDAQKFLSLLTIVGAPKNFIDRFIMEYIPGTISFNMAQEMVQNR